MQSTLEGNRTKAYSIKYTCIPATQSKLSATVEELIHCIECISSHSQCAIQPETCFHELFMKDLGCSSTVALSYMHFPCIALSHQVSELEGFHVPLFR